MTRSTRFTALAAAALAGTFSAAAGEKMTPTKTGPGYVWWEGEDTTSDNLNISAEDIAWMHEGEAAKILSGGRQLVVRGKVPAGGWLATWRIEVPKTASYEFWGRVGYRPWSGNEWRFDDGEWNATTKNHSFHQVVHFAKWRPVSWTMLDHVKLEKGVHVFQIRVKGVEQALQGFDCFILSEGPFVPLGKYRPDEKITPIPSRGGAEGWWVFQPVFPKGEKKVVDLSAMNKPIDKGGWVKLKPDGELYYRDGTKVRFWGLNAGYWGGRMVFPSHATADRFAEHLAQIGVNCVRTHILHSTNSLIDDTRDDTQHFDAEKLDRLCYLIHALRKRNIRINIDMIYHRMFKKGDNMPPSLTGKGKEGNYNYGWAAGAAAHFYPRAVQLNRELYRKLLTHVNPYTRKRLIDDKVLGMLSIQNEQSIFWGTTNSLKGEVREEFDRQYTEWLKKKYRTQKRLAEAWQVPGQGSPFGGGENLGTGRIKVGRVASGGGPKGAKRAVDQLKFLYHIETKFYRETIAAMRSWGLKAPIITSNWRGSGQTTRLVLQASTLGQIVDRHHYFNRSQSMLKAVGRGMPMAAFEAQAGRAFCISEWNHGVDGQYVAETVPLLATVAAFQGWDALFQFAPSSPGWETQMSGLQVTPGHYALYPIAAMIFRRMDIRAGDVVFERLRDPGYQFSFARDERGAAPEVLAVGRVRNRYVEQRTPDVLRQDQVEKLWDKQAGVCRAGTGEFDWHYKDGWLRLNSKRTQGAFGAIGRREVSCDDVKINTPNPHCAVIVTAMEKKPIPEAARLLVAAVGRAMNMKAGPASSTQVPPCMMEPVKGTVSVKTSLRKVYAVTAVGYRAGEVKAERKGGWLTFRMEGAPQILYYEITK